jgi:DNA modification methylase
MTLPKPYYEEEGIVIYNADCRDILPLLPSVDLVLTDPPYGVDAAAWDGSVPYELLSSFLNHKSVIWFGAASKLWESADSFSPRPDRVMIWGPRFSLSKTMANGMAYRWHPIYCWNIPKEHEGPTWDIVDDSTECGNWWNHNCTKPLTLMRKLAGFCPVGGTVLDPFMGSGTTLRAAKDLGRKAIGIEIEEKYCAIAVERLRQEVLPLEGSCESS